MQTTKNKALWLFVLHSLLFFLSLSGVLSKFAAQQDLFSFSFLALYGLELVILFVYAILWQQVLKHMSLTVAFSNKAVGMVWSMLWGVLLFQEVLTIKMVIGAAIVMVGVLLVVRSDG